MRDATATPIDDYLDDLLRHLRADPRTTRRLLDEAADHLHTAAADYQRSGSTRVDAEREAVRSLGPVGELARGTWLHSFTSLVSEVVRAAILLGGCGLVAVGVSGGLAAIMNALAGYNFVGAATVLGMGGSSVTESAQDAVSLRVFAGTLGLIVLAAYALVRRRIRPGTVLPGGLTDALGAAAFAAATVVLTSAAVDQAVTTSSAHGVGFFLSGALASLGGAVLFCTRATRRLLAGHDAGVESSLLAV